MASPQYAMTNPGWVSSLNEGGVRFFVLEMMERREATGKVARRWRGSALEGGRCQEQP